MDTIMGLPDNIHVMEAPSTYYWFDEAGILCAVNKKTPPLPYEQVVQMIEELKQLTQNKKICMLMDVTHSPSSNKQVREYTAQQFPKMVKALAMVSASPLSRMLAYLFLAVVRTPFPAKMFNNVAEAKAWLKQYVD